MASFEGPFFYSRWEKPRKSNSVNKERPFLFLRAACVCVCVCFLRSFEGVDTHKFQQQGGFIDLEPRPMAHRSVNAPRGRWTTTPFPYTLLARTHTHAAWGRGTSPFFAAIHFFPSFFSLSELAFFRLHFFLLIYCW